MLIIGGTAVPYILHVVKRVLEEFIKLPNNENPEKKGGYLTIFDLATRMVCLIIAVGDFPPEKAKKYFSFSQEKAIRVYNHPKHLSSHQSRDGIKRWGGSIRANNLILSFSGLPELGDEAVVLITAYFSELIDWHNATRIATISENPYFAPLCEAMKRHL